MRHEQDLFTAMSIPQPDVPHKPKFLEEVRPALRLRHYSIRTEQTYLDWIRQFIIFHGRAGGQSQNLATLFGPRAGAAVARFAFPKEHITPPVWTRKSELLRLIRLRSGCLLAVAARGLGARSLRSASGRQTTVAREMAGPCFHSEHIAVGWLAHGERQIQAPGVVWTIPRAKTARR